MSERRSPGETRDGNVDGGFPGCTRATSAAALQHLRERFGARASTAPAVREQHSHGVNLPDAGLPELVVFAESNDEVAEIARTCFEARMPMVPFGAGSSLEGQVAALHGGVSVDLTAMKAVLEVNPDALDCRVQAGVTRLQLDDPSCVARACSSRSTLAPMRRWAAWPPRGLRARRPCATARCATPCSGSRW